MFQVCERRKHQLIESHISCYSVQKTVNTTAGIPYQLRAMRLDVFVVVVMHISILMTSWGVVYCFSFLLLWYQLNPFL